MTVGFLSAGSRLAWPNWTAVTGLFGGASYGIVAGVPAGAVAVTSSSVPSASWTRSRYGVPLGTYTRRIDFAGAANAIFTGNVLHAPALAGLELARNAPTPVTVRSATAV